MEGKKWQWGVEIKTTKTKTRRRRKVKENKKGIAQINDDDVS